MRASATDIFYLPLTYLHRVRLEQSMGRIASWWFLMVVPTLGYYLLALPQIGMKDLLSYLLLLVAVVTYYELGYMLNDTYATRREEHPTLRQSEEQTMYLYRHVGIIFGIRMAIVLGILCLYGAINTWSRVSLVTIIGVLLLLPLFCLYNRIRGKNAVTIYPVLVGWRYLVFMLPVWGSDSFWICTLLLLLSYPIEIGIERYSMPGRRYGKIARLIPDEKSKQQFRARYYTIVLLSLLPIWWEHPWWCLPMLCIGIYRWIRVAVKK